MGQSMNCSYLTSWVSWLSVDPAFVYLFDGLLSNYPADMIKTASHTDSITLIKVSLLRLVI